MAELPSLISFMVYVEVKHHERIRKKNGRVQDCVKVEVAVLGSPSLLTDSPSGLCGRKPTMVLNV